MFKVLCLLLPAVALAAIPDSRHADPVILMGTDLPELIGQDPAAVVGFRFNAEAASWEQVPVQIDEKHMQDWEIIKQGDCRLIGRNSVMTVYADEGTYSGLDEDAAFDNDDELVFMARHLGDAKPNGFMNPTGTQSGFELLLNIQDPLLGLSSIGYLYLFLSDGSINPDANAPLVQYNLNLVNMDENGSNNYFDAYQFNCTFGQSYECHLSAPVNPEDSWFISPHYEKHFAEGWFSDQLKIKVGTSNGENFYNTEDVQFLLNTCLRSMHSFVRGRMAFIINKSGPVRAIRAFVGANSGIINERQHHMYEQREDQITYLRVHTIPGIFQYESYKAGTPMTYYNCHNTDGIVVDGVDDGEAAFDNAICEWELVQGEFGTHLRTIEVQYDFGAMDITQDFEHWFYDNEMPECEDCGNRDSAKHPNGWHMCSSIMNRVTSAWGSHGVRTRDLIMPNTDPNRNLPNAGLPEEACRLEFTENTLHNFKVTFHSYFLEPETDPSVGQQYLSNSATGLVREM